MPKYKPGDSIYWPQHQTGWRIILGVDVDRSIYKVTPFYSESSGEAYSTAWDGAQQTELSFTFVDNDYRAVATSGDEKVAADTSPELERLRDQVAALVAKEQMSMVDWETASQILNDAASNHGWCDAYETILNDINRSIRTFQFPPRSRDYNVNLCYYADVTLTVNAVDEDDALNQARSNVRLPDSDRDGNPLSWDENYDSTSVEDADY